MKYIDFLKSKVAMAEQSGFDVSESEVNRALLPHQRDAVRWAVKGGRRALFEAFGLGKTVQELEWCRIVTEHEGGRALVVLPLGVRQEFARDAVELLGMDPPQYVRTAEEVKSTEGNICITNYERVRDGDIDPTEFIACCLDEASVLRSFGSKTYQTFLDRFRGVKYKLVATATPDPNRYKELIHYAGFLEVMDTGQALTRFFQRDSQKAGNLTLYPHKENEFWTYSYKQHVEMAKGLDEDGRLPATFMVVAPGSWTDEVWDDINRIRTLNTTQSQRRQNLHVCPLQLDIVERIINRYSNPGDLVFDPFAGLFTVPYMAVKMGRRGLGTELNLDYYRDGVGYLQSAEADREAPTLFDFVEGGAACE